MAEEASYILNRKEHKSQFPGNTLPRPGLLLNPWVVGSTETDTQVAALGGEYADVGFGGGGGGGGGGISKERRMKQTARRSSGGRAPRNGGQMLDDNFGTLDFLAHPGVTLANIPVMGRGGGGG